MLSQRCKMPANPASLLIVDDDASLRLCLSAVFATEGHGVRTAEDGFSALAQLRRQIPDIIVSDLNMPGMSGFEFLTVVRQRFPTIRVVAMSSAFAADSMPPGVVADAFYRKGSEPGSLLRMVEAMTHPERPAAAKHENASEPTNYKLQCPECLRTFPPAAAESCTYCAAPLP
jgi:CheY-like chemotaxis protein